MRRGGEARRRVPRGYVVRLVVAGLFGVVLLAAGIDRFRDHSTLMERGIVVDATIVEVGSKGSVTVRFSPGSGGQVEAVVANAPSDVELSAGGTLPVRYDPQDPAGRVEAVGQDQAAISRWFYVLAGAALLGLVIYGSLWMAGMRRS